ncbi:J domain-containing protein [Sphingomonas albertensis]|uniref:DnaJ domain-containing protein n=1 Tax=Sphingomonas albertensis TaxID=2762591 RepID=A0ABR7ALG2_9SPHN|nr:DnaJ domain-containing protein [Sphingomonas albertensis]MBC3941295.1 DnaJ domain-containing protein [Sphingomonas albertensis]
MTQRDFYQVLGVVREATPADIRAAFVRLVRHHHPDHAPTVSDLTNRLADVQEAYRCLSDPDARERHDRALEDNERRHFARQRSVQRRLRRYDMRHPRLQPTSYRRFRWGPLLIALVSAAIVTRITLTFIG